MSATWSPAFRDENRRSRYPFGDAASLRAVTGLELPHDLFLDAALHPIGARAGLRLTQVEVAAGLVTLAFGDDAAPALCTTGFDPAAPPETLALVDGLGRPAGVLVADPARLSVAGSWPAGTHKFAPGSSELAASCVLPTPELAVRGIAVEGGRPLTGAVWLVGGPGVVLSHDGGIRVDVVGDPQAARRLCVEAGRPVVTPRYIRTINEIPADEFGEFRIVRDPSPADSILRVGPAGGALELGVAAPDRELR